MQTENRLFDDIAKVASGALNTLGSLREEIEARVRERVERLANDLDLVSREEFDAIKAVATKARAEQESLTLRVSELESRLADLEVAESKAARRKKTAETPSPDEAES
jgi:BMFP domain-containing protein YqiC